MEHTLDPTCKPSNFALSCCFKGSARYMQISLNLVDRRVDKLEYLLLLTSSVTRDRFSKLIRSNFPEIRDGARDVRGFELVKRVRASKLLFTFVIIIHTRPINPSIIFA